MSDTKHCAHEVNPPETAQRSSTLIEWFAEGKSCIVDVDGVQLDVRYVGRKGRRARIAITAPAGAVFRGEAV